MDAGFQVKSSTNRGTRNLPRGQVVANIVRANIPVENGVVHLIGEIGFGVESDILKSNPEINLIFR